MEEKESIIAYIAFDDALSSENGKYKVGETYKIRGAFNILSNNFRAWEFPMDAIACSFGLHIAEVEMGGEIEKSNLMSDVFSSEMTIKRELTLNEAIGISIEWLKTHDNKKYEKKVNFDEMASCTASNESKANIVSNGAYSKVSSNGDYSSIGLYGFASRMSSSGMVNRIVSNESFSQISSSGESPTIFSNGECTKIATSGSCGKIYATGIEAKLSTSGSGGKIYATGIEAKLSTSGSGVKIHSEGSCSRLSTSGDYNTIYSYGENANIASSGYSTSVDSSGKEAIVSCTGANSMVKAKKGSWVTLAEWQTIVGHKKLICVKTEYVDGERIKEDTWYKLENGEFVESTENCKNA